MSKAVWAYIGALLAFLVLDGLWLGLLMSSTYKELLGSLMLAQPKWGPAIVFVAGPCPGQCAQGCSGRCVFRAGGLWHL